MSPPTRKRRGSGSKKDKKGKKAKQRRKSTKISTQRKASYADGETAPFWNKAPAAASSDCPPREPSDQLQSLPLAEETPYESQPRLAEERRESLAALRLMLSDALEKRVTDTTLRQLGAVSLQTGHLNMAHWCSQMLSDRTPGDRDAEALHRRVAAAWESGSEECRERERARELCEHAVAAGEGSKERRRLLCRLFHGMHSLGMHELLPTLQNTASDARLVALFDKCFV